MRISVALCTYNGAAYVGEQLGSIAAQTRPPDELVACDDRSADDTVGVLRAFARTAPFPVRVEVNPANLGSSANFARAVALCTGDVIALSDQDDVWRPDKLAVVERELAADPAAAFVFSDAAVVDSRLTPLGYTLWEAIRFTPAHREQFRRGDGFRRLLRRYCVTGAAMAFRGRFRDRLLPVADGWVHDGWFALLLSAVAHGRPVAEPLLSYRQHPTQQIGEKKRGLVAQYRVARAMGPAAYQGVVTRYRAAAERIADWPDVHPGCREALAEKVAHFERRVRMRGRWRLPAVAREAATGRYSRYSLGWKSIAQDLFLP